MGRSFDTFVRLGFYWNIVLHMLSAKLLTNAAESVIGDTSVELLNFQQPFHHNPNSHYLTESTRTLRSFTTTSVVSMKKVTLHMVTMEGIQRHIFVKLASKRSLRSRPY